MLSVFKYYGCEVLMKINKVRARCQYNFVNKNTLYGNNDSVL